MNATTLRYLAGAALSAALLAAPVPLAAQTDDSSPILSDLKTNPDIEVLAQPGDPAVRKANAIVNGDVVTDTDVDQRLNLVLASNPARVSDEERLRLRMQVMRNLIDEKLQIQESGENDIAITPAEIEQAYERVAANFEMEADQFGEFLKTRGTSEMSIKQQIHAELAWSRLLRRQVEPFVNVGDDEVENMIARLEAAKGTTEYRVGELVFFTSPSTAPQVMQEAERIAQQLRQGASFVAYARQYSQSSTATLGGDLGYVQLEQLPSELQPVIEQLGEGQITRPIQIPGAVVILALIDKRQILTVDEDDAVLSLKQLTLDMPENATQESVDAFVAQLQNRLGAMGGCGGVERLAGELGAEVTVNDQLRLGDLPPQMKAIMSQMQVGQSTPPFGSPEEGIKVLTLCGREQPREAGAPNFSNMYAELERSRVNMRARRYLRDLRRDAIIDYR